MGVEGEVEARWNQRWWNQGGSETCVKPDVWSQAPGKLKDSDSTPASSSNQQHGEPEHNLLLSGNGIDASSSKHGHSPSPCLCIDSFEEKSSMVVLVLH